MRIETERCVVRRMRAEDAPELYEVLSDPLTMACLEPPFSMKRTLAFIAGPGAGEAPLAYSICHKAEGRVVGHLIFHPWENADYELGWVLNRRCWRQGLAGELTRAVIEHARRRGIPALVIECLPAQKATRAIAERFGFAFCGIRDGLHIYRLKLR
ncbi:MAG: GNAT family N-acetyltransferase [Clostridia bacterium]|nr:GNAT family N-acetyltransferase [Clostridia bacterium]